MAIEVVPALKALQSPLKRIEHSSLAHDSTASVAPRALNAGLEGVARPNDSKLSRKAPA